ncbi:fungal specific transcription factor domain-containing protein [Colletotrichum graminicola M1.001]|uniref:Fungal specific transcription factor domain-containing protein n=1 Tax=Colletotrichum graminicola (strain M1.001 / M2 / FGSC 10212) TaxID=645133 RepID=E3Q3P0_COLGM|nr:fungal specific transcription factor domain-containing protein [Colletotrichum graminicola M1.001]EFQ25642.1 fungal specific transcription factor domain-containing protein [Colletotrichum graminicola M1.001]
MPAEKAPRGQIRCSRTFPCTSCSSALAKCEFRESDFKRPPVSRENVATLESRIASLESLVGRLKTADSDERNRILDDLEDQDYVPSFSSLPLEDEIALSEAMTKASFQEMTDGSLIYHGPTSIYQNEASSPAYPPTSSPTVSKPSFVHENREVLVNDTMRLCIGLFFHWQYPVVMFIDRESFIQEYEANPVNGNYCSPPLIYSMAAIGALMSRDPDVKAKSPGFADTAQSILMTIEFGVSRPTSVQAFLCLSYYETGVGNMSKAWVYTGIAYRMCQDLGLQRDLAHWSPDAKSNLSSPFPFNNEFRRRVYWGCFLSDKMFSLFLGRPTFLLDPPIWDNWLQAHGLGFLQTGQPGGPRLTPWFNQMLELGRIVHDMLSKTFAPKKMKDPSARRWNELSLSKLNARLVAWHEALPSEMRWKKWTTNKDVLQPHVACLHTFYHSTRICLNLPFITSVRQIPSVPDGEAEDLTNPIIKSFIICQSSAQRIVDVLQRFRAQHTLENTPLNFIGATILATNAVLATTRRQSSPPSLLKDTLLPFLDSALEELSSSWKLAGEARQKVRNALNLAQVRHPQSPVRTRQPDRATDGKDRACDQPPVVNPVEAQASADPPLEKSSGPEETVLDPMGLLDSEAAYWGGYRNDMVDVWDANFVNHLADADWLNQPHMPE